MAEKRIVLLKKANKYFRQQKNEAAVKEYKKVLNIKPDDLEVRRIIGDIELKIKNIKGAIEQFEWMADYYLKEGFFTKAIAMYKRITRIDPKYDKASFRLAELYTRQGLIIEAKQIYLEMAEEFKRNSNQRRALDMYKKILEFDRNNIKMRLLLAENYLREKLLDQAVNEYLISFDIMLNKKEYAKVEEISLNVIKKVKNTKLVEKLVHTYKIQGKDDEAIALLKGLGSELFNNKNLLKILGELYFEKNLIDDAEAMFKKITDIDPTESEVLLKLGKVYLQREEYDKTFNLFLPIIDSYLSEDKVEDATAMLRLIIASNNLYFPALTKLASIFRDTGKKTNLIALNESLIPLFESKKMDKELKEVLEELIKISDSPFNYEEKLHSLATRSAAGTDEVENGEISEEKDREIEVISQGLRVAGDALKEFELEKALEILRKVKNEYPDNIEINLKLYETYKKNNEVTAALTVGKELLSLYKASDNEDQYQEMLNDLANLAPEDEKIVELSGEEKTNIDINFDQAEIEDQMNDIENTGMQEIDLGFDAPSDSNVLLLSKEDSIVEKSDKGMSDSYGSVSGYLSEIDFYINDGYFSDAEKLAEELLDKFPENKEIKKKISQLQKVKSDRIKKMDSGSNEEKIPDLVPEETADGDGSDDELQIEFTSQPAQFDLNIDEETFSVKDNSSTFKEDSNYQIKLNGGSKVADSEEISSFKIEDQISSDPSIFGDSKNILELSDSDINSPEVLSPEPVDDAGGSVFEIDIDSIPAAEDKISTGVEFSEISSKQYEIELEEPLDLDDVIVEKIDEDLLVQSPSVKKDDNFKDTNLSSSGVLLSLDNAIEDDSPDEDVKPFEELSHDDIIFDKEEELLKDEVNFPDENQFLENEKNVGEELNAVQFWMKELEKQRTSTVEKNMMEIFEEFKKGVDEKIGKEDFDTRYNLGIAYKEMGLLEEAIHEFLIASKHPAKFFDSAGLLGMCFREKGLMDDAITWFKKALEEEGRKKEEYLAVKYELIITHKLKNDYKAELEVIEDIYKINPNYRDIENLKKSITKIVNG